MERNILEVRVARGAELLDRVFPGWEEIINLEILHMRYASQCILGQLYDNYGLGVGELFDELDDLAIDYGFTSSGWDVEEWEDLTDAWTQFILKRKG